MISKSEFPAYYSKMTTEVKLFAEHSNFCHLIQTL